MIRNLFGKSSRSHGADSALAQTVVLTPDALVDWMRTWVANRLKIDVAEIDPDEDVMELGLDSLSIVQLTGDLERASGRPVAPDIALDYPTIRSIADHLCEGDATT